MINTIHFGIKRSRKWLTLETFDYQSDFGCGSTKKVKKDGAREKGNGLLFGKFYLSFGVRK